MDNQKKPNWVARICNIKVDHEYGDCPQAYITVSMVDVTGCADHIADHCVIARKIAELATAHTVAKENEASE